MNVRVFKRQIQRQRDLDSEDCGVTVSQRKRERLTDNVNTYREADNVGCSSRIMRVERDQLVNYMLH